MVNSRFKKTAEHLRFHVSDQNPDISKSEMIKHEGYEKKHTIESNFCGKRTKKSKYTETLQNLYLTYCLLSKYNKTLQSLYLNFYLIRKYYYIFNTFYHGI